MNSLRLLLLGLLALMLLVGCEASGDDDDDDADDDADDDDDSGGDTTPPTIESVTELPNTDDQSGPYPVEARISDNVGVAGVRLYYDVGQGFQDFWMAPFGTDGYRGQIPGQAPGTTIRYFVKAWDDALNESYWPAGGLEAPWVFHVRGVIELAYDDGLPDSFYGVPRAGDMLVVCFTPPSYPAQLITFSHYVWDYNTPDDRYRPIVFYDPAGADSPPQPNAAVWRGDTIASGVSWREWYNFELGDEPALQDPLESGNFYVGVEFSQVADDVDDILTFGLDTTEPTQARTWYYQSSSFTWMNLDEHFHIPGNLMFRTSVQLK